MRRIVTLAALAATLATGCIDSLPLAQVVLDTRVIGARLEVDGAPERAWPRPDDTGVVTWNVVDPTETVPSGWAFVVCPAMVTPSGLSFCAGDPLDILFQMEPSTDPPSFPVSFPSAALTGATDVLVQGVICPNGSPDVDLENFDVSCAGMGEPRQLASFTIHIERDGVSNANPTVPADALTWAGASWNESPTVPPETGCRDMAGTAELPLASRQSAPEMGFDNMGNEVVQEIITITGDPADREEFMSADRVILEDLIFAHYTAIGEPTRQFSVNDGMESTAELKWSYPTAEMEPTLPDDGILGRWWITVIDQRGGTAWTERFVCIVP